VAISDLTPARGVRFHYPLLRPCVGDRAKWRRWYGSWRRAAALCAFALSAHDGPVVASGRRRGQAGCRNSTAPRRRSDGGNSSAGPAELRKTRLDARRCRNRQLRSSGHADAPCSTPLRLHEELACYGFPPAGPGGNHLDIPVSSVGESRRLVDYLMAKSSGNKLHAAQSSR